MPNKRRDLILGLGIAGVTLVLIFLLVILISQRDDYEGSGFYSKGDKVAVVELLGPIYDSKGIVSQFKRYRESKSVRAIVFRIDSPGGGVAPAQEIYEAVKRVKNEGKPVIVSMGSVAASGGYYVACAADTIMAASGTTTGSIGVLAEFVNTESLFNKLGIEFEVIKSGPFKDTGTPFRGLTPTERQYLQEWVNDAYEQFIEVVIEDRAIPREEVMQLADGRVFTGNQAKALGLVDLIGDYEEAISLAAQLGGIQGEPMIIKERKRRIHIFDLLFQQLEDVLRGMSGITLQYRFE